MKYRCTHCNHSFELAERDFQRCPNCFWTTSLVSLEEETEGAQSFKKLEPFPSSAPKSNFVNAKLLIILLICAALGGLIGIFAVLRPSLPKFSFPIPFSVPEVLKQKPKEVPRGKPTAPAVTFLSVEEKARLFAPFPITIPRQLTEDEEEILKKQVSPPKPISEKLQLSVWTKEEFEKTFESEQKKRKVYLGWAYERAVKKTFEKYYPSAVEAYEKGDHVSARDLFLKSLAFPIYRNDPRRHRAIALVILRPYLNDVIGKIAILNQYLMSQRLTTEVDSISRSYQALFPVLELQEWDRASQMMTDLKRQMDAFENRPSEEPVDYGPSFVLLDPEIRTAIQIEAQPKPEAVVNLKTLTVDLNLKEKVVRQNKTEELLQVQKQYEEISRSLETGDLEAARDRLKGIEFPPELFDDARAKIALIDQAFALQKTKEDKKK
ncbi:MAG TPA: hypothetical protein VJA00_03350 [Candidatus Omnitrophota bacterium]|nr:hypothetical protein [Candidatus Omnitrophota bacterium]